MLPRHLSLPEIGSQAASEWTSCGKATQVRAIKREEPMSNSVYKIIDLVNVVKRIQFAQRIRYMLGFGHGARLLALG